MGTEIWAQGILMSRLSALSPELIAHLDQFPFWLLKSSEFHMAALFLWRTTNLENERRRSIQSLGATVCAVCAGEKAQMPKMERPHWDPSPHHCGPASPAPRVPALLRLSCLGLTPFLPAKRRKELTGQKVHTLCSPVNGLTHFPSSH